MPRNIATPPLDGMLIHRMVTPEQYVAGTHLYTWVKTKWSKEPCLMKPAPLDSELEALTGPPHTPSHRQMKPYDQHTQAFVLTPSHPYLDPPPWREYV